MSELLLTRMTATLSELKQNPIATVASAEGLPIAIIRKSLNSPVSEKHAHGELCSSCAYLLFGAGLKHHLFSYFWKSVVFVVCFCWKSVVF